MAKSCLVFHRMQRYTKEGGKEGTPYWHRFNSRFKFGLDPGLLSLVKSDYWGDDDEMASEDNREIYLLPCFIIAKLTTLR